MNARAAGIAGAIYAIAIVISLFVGALLPVAIIGALVVGLVYRLAAGKPQAGQGRQRNRNRERARG